MENPLSIGITGGLSMMPLRAKDLSQSVLSLISVLALIQILRNGGEKGLDKTRGMSDRVRPTISRLGCRLVIKQFLRDNGFSCKSK